MLSFLRTGELGPLKLGLTMREVSELLGPPAWWTDGGSVAPVPLLWGYRPFLEVLFGREPPYLLEMIKITQLPAASRKYVQIARLRMDSDGFHDEMRPSDFLRRLVWREVDALIVGRQNDSNPIIDICTNKTRLVWSMSITGEEMLQRQSDSGLSEAAYMARRDQLSDGFLGIYSSRSPKLDRAPLHGWSNFTSDQYLALIGSAETNAE